VLPVCGDLWDTIALSRMLRPSTLTILVLASGLLHALAFPPWNITPIAWVALVPFLLVLHARSPRVAFVYGLLWGTAAHWAEALWVLPAMAFYYRQPWWFAGLFGIGSSLVFRGLHYGTQRPPERVPLPHRGEPHRLRAGAARFQSRHGDPQHVVRRRARLCARSVAPRGRAESSPESLPGAVLAAALAAFALMNDRRRRGHDGSHDRTHHPFGSTAGARQRR
jgi:hypothetical protein